MASGIRSSLYSTFYYCFQEAITRQLVVPRSLYRRNSTIPFFLRHSTSFLSDTTPCSSIFAFKGKSMAASSSKAFLGDIHMDDVIASCSSALDVTKHTGVYFKDRDRKGCLIRANVNIRRPELSYGPLSFRCSIFYANWRKQNSSLLHAPWLKNFSKTSPACFPAGAAQQVSFDGSTRDDQQEYSFLCPDQTIVSERTLKLVSGSSYLPHPDKEETGGEDAHFICEDEQAIGVADGVGGWADVGVNAGLFARELMSNSVRAIQEEPQGSIDPLRVLEKAHSGTKAKGSSTACIIAITDKGLHAINLGDSGFVVIRDGCIIFKSHVQQHGFNFTYQLESGNGGDLPSSGEVSTIPVMAGDVIIAGTDGLFDNLYYNEVTAIVVNARRTRQEPQVTAQKIAALARSRAQDRNRQTPFATAAQEAGFRYHGGKLDDITVVVSYVTNIN